MILLEHLFSPLELMPDFQSEPWSDPSCQLMWHPATSLIAMSIAMESVQGLGIWEWTEQPQGWLSCQYMSIWDNGLLPFSDVFASFCTASWLGKLLAAKAVAGWGYVQLSFIPPHWEILGGNCSTMGVENSRLAESSWQTSKTTPGSFKHLRHRRVRRDEPVDTVRTLAASRCGRCHTFLAKETSAHLDPAATVGGLTYMKSHEPSPIRQLLHPPPSRSISSGPRKRPRGLSAPFESSGTSTGCAKPGCKAYFRYFFHFIDIIDIIGIIEYHWYLSISMWAHVLAHIHTHIYIDIVIHIYLYILVQICIYIYILYLYIYI